jgi:hypothetical protein
MAGNFILDGSKSRDPENTGDIVVVRAGRLLGKITASKKYAPATIGTLVNAEIATSTQIELSSAQATELVRRVGSTGNIIITGPPTAGGTVANETVAYTAVDTGTGAVTCGSLSNAYIAGSFVGTDDGTRVPTIFIPDGYGVQAVDSDLTTDIDNGLPRMPIGGVVDFTQLIPAPTDTSLIQWVIDQLNATQRGRYVFDNDYL